MKRYSVPIAVEYNGIEEDPEGEWVRYEDVKKEFHKYRIEYSVCEDMVEELQEVNKELLEALEDAERVLEWGEPEPKPILERVRRVIA